MKRCLLLLTALYFFCAGCEVKVNTGDDDKKTVAAETTTNGSKVRNDIDLKASGLKIEQAFLLYEDGSLVPQDNKVGVNEKVNMRLILSGWKEKEGKVFFGASEKIETNEGDVFVDEPDLFEQYEKEGVSPKDAEYLSLSAKITKVDKLFDYFLVSFRVWDKKGNGEVTGSYKLYLK